jgi:hypothetical protein
MRLWQALPLLFAGCLGVLAHVGNPNVVFEGKAGGYPILVVIRQPDVVPGLAEIAIRVESGAPDSITVLPLHWNTDRSGAPRPDVAKRVDGQTNIYSAALWLMVKGAYGVEVTTVGPDGGSVVVPVNSIALAEKQMQKPLGILMAILGSLLVVGAVSIISSAARESTMASGESVTPARRRRGRMGAIGSFALFTLAIYSGRNWWNGLAEEHRNSVVFHSLTNTMTLSTNGGAPKLVFKITDPRRSRGSYALVADHGKLIHLFLVGPGISNSIAPSLAHIHPVRAKDPWTFESTLPALPAGQYKIFTDLTHESGLTQTLTNTIDFSLPVDPGIDGWHPSDGEDSARLPSGDSGPTHLGDGYTMRLSVSSGSPRVPVTLDASVIDASGKPAQLQPYLRMLGHAVVVRSDGNVFSHLHPSGTFSLAAARRFAVKTGGESAARTTDAVCGDLAALSPAETAALGKEGKVSFPFVFPEPGRYWVWVQVRVGDSIRTGAMTVDVQDAVASR